MPTRSYDHAPAGLPLMLRAALPAIPLVGRLPGIRHAPSGVPDLTLERAGVTTDAGHLERYNEVCGFARSDTLPATYPHIAVFALQLALMTEPAFPFAPMGLVHLRNSIHQYRPIGATQTYDVSTRAQRLRPHPRGRLIDLLATASVGGEIVWEETSTYLSRHRGGAEEETPAPLAGIDAPDGVVQWRLAGNLGRRYASVSGDRNPIHLHRLSAKAFGFANPIAHGMWTKARCLAALQNRLPDAFSVHVEFRRPILLPATTVFGTERTADGDLFGVRGLTTQITHLAGLVIAER